MHERNGAQLVCLAALGAVNCLGSMIALILANSASPDLGTVVVVVVATAWLIWLGALRSWVRSVQFARAPGIRSRYRSRPCTKARPSAA